MQIDAKQIQMNCLKSDDNDECGDDDDDDYDCFACKCKLAAIYEVFVGNTSDKHVFPNIVWF